MDHKKVIQEYYSKRARDYDRQKIRTWQSQQGFGAEVLDEVIDDLATFKRKLVLEIGVGSGRIGFPLLKKVGPWFVGLDLSREMLGLAKAKMSSYKRKFNLILGDAEHMPFERETFDAIICISTMHYFDDPETSLSESSRILKGKGIFVYGDLTLHESDNCSFLDTLEKILSQAHARYYKRSEIKKLLKNHGFSISRTKTIAYRKSYLSLIEDKARYFNVKPEAVHGCIGAATTSEKMLYAMDSEGLTLFYTLITALKQSKS